MRTELRVAASILPTFGVAACTVDPSPRPGDLTSERVTAFALDRSAALPALDRIEVAA